MTTKKIRGPVPSLIGLSNGKPDVIVAKGKSECYRCQSSIAAGTTCFVIPKIESGFTSSKRHCKDCFNDILEQLGISLNLNTDFILKVNTNFTLFEQRFHIF